MTVDPEAAEVKAAGGVVWRRAGDTIAIAVAHRPRYDDWSLPKGKLDEGESWEDGALREVEEETGMRCELGRELDPVTYRDRKGRLKLVRWWEMTPVGGEFAIDYGHLLNPPRFVIPQVSAPNAIFQLHQDQIHFRFSQAF